MSSPEQTSQTPEALLIQDITNEAERILAENPTEEIPSYFAKANYGEGATGIDVTSPNKIDILSKITLPDGSIAYDHTTLTHSSDGSGSFSYTWQPGGESMTLQVDAGVHGVQPDREQDLAGMQRFKSMLESAFRPVVEVAPAPRVSRKERIAKFLGFGAIK